MKQGRGGKEVQKSNGSKKGSLLLTEKALGILGPDCQTNGVLAKKAARLVEKQLRNLTQLRLKDQIDDAHYLAERQRLLAEEKSLAAPVAALDPVEPAKAVVSLLNQAPELFLHGDVRVKRAILEAVGSNPRLREKKLLIEARKPFALVREGVRNPSWCG